MGNAIASLAAHGFDQAQFGANLTAWSGLRSQHGFEETAIPRRRLLLGHGELVRKIPGVAGTRVGYNSGDVYRGHRNHGTHAGRSKWYSVRRSSVIAGCWNFSSRFTIPAPSRRATKRVVLPFGIHFTTPERRQIALEAIADVGRLGLPAGQVVTSQTRRPLLAGRAEHQDYLQRRPNGLHLPLSTPAVEAPRAGGYMRLRGCPGQPVRRQYSHKRFHDERPDPVNAPQLRVPQWIDAHGNPIGRSRAGRSRRQVQGYFCFQHGCRVVIARISDSKKRWLKTVQGASTFAAVQSRVRESAEINARSFCARRSSDTGYQSHSGMTRPWNAYPSLMADFETRGTPWFIVIDPAGEVIHSGFRLDTEHLLGTFGGADEPQAM